MTSKYEKYNISLKQRSKRKREIFFFSLQKLNKNPATSSSATGPFRSLVQWMSCIRLCLPGQWLIPTAWCWGLLPLARTGSSGLWTVGSPARCVLGSGLLVCRHTTLCRTGVSFSGGHGDGNGQFADDIYIWWAQQHVYINTHSHTWLLLSQTPVIFTWVTKTNVHCFSPPYYVLTSNWSTNCTSKPMRLSQSSVTRALYSDTFCSSSLGSVTWASSVNIWHITRKCCLSIVGF